MHAEGFGNDPLHALISFLDFVGLGRELGGVRILYELGSPLLKTLSQIPNSDSFALGSDHHVRLVNRHHDVANLKPHLELAPLTGLKSQ